MSKKKKTADVKLGKQEELEAAETLAPERLSSVRLAVKGQPDKWIEVAALSFFDENFVAAQSGAARTAAYAEILRGLPEGALRPAFKDVPIPIERVAWLLRIGIVDAAGFEVDWVNVTILGEPRRLITLDSLRGLPRSLQAAAEVWVEELTGLDEEQVERLDFGSPSQGSA